VVGLDNGLYLVVHLLNVPVGPDTGRLINILVRSLDALTLLPVGSGIEISRFKP
jgi:hypothetical protein